MILSPLTVMFKTFFKTPKKKEHGAQILNKVSWFFGQLYKWSINEDFATSWRKAPVFLSLYFPIPSLKTNISRKNRPLEARRFLLETITFWCENVSFREDICWTIWGKMVFLRPFFWPGFDVTKNCLGVLVLREIAKSSVKNQARLRRKLCWHKINARICWSKNICDIWCLSIFQQKAKVIWRNKTGNFEKIFIFHYLFLGTKSGVIPHLARLPVLKKQKKRQLQNKDVLSRHLEGVVPNRSLPFRS